MDQALAAIHQTNRGGEPLLLILRGQAGTVGLSLGMGANLRWSVERQLLAQYPDAAIDRHTEEPLGQNNSAATFIASISLAPDVFPIRRYVQFEDAINRTLADPIAGVLAALNCDGMRGVRCRIEWDFVPARASRIARAKRCVARLNRPFFRGHPRLAKLYTTAATCRVPPIRWLAWMLTASVSSARPSTHDVLMISPTREHDREDDLQAASDKLGRPLFSVAGRIVIHAPVEARRLAEAKRDEIAGALGQFSASRLGALRVGPLREQLRSQPSFLLSCEELATLFHPPVQAATPDMAVVESRELPAPVALPTPAMANGLSILGMARSRGRTEQFGLPPVDRLRHLAIFGKTGMGKSTLLRNMIATDIAGRRGVTFIDPHGDTCDELLGLIPTSRTNDVIHFNPADPNSVPSLNLLACDQPHQRALVASGVLTAFKKLYADFWGPRMEHLLRNSLLALLEVPGATLANVLNLLSDDRYRQLALTHISDPVIRAFWQNEYAQLPPRLRAEAAAPVQNKIGHLVTNPTLRRVVAQSRSTLHMRRVLDDGRVLLVALSKGRIGEDASMLLGSLIVTALQIAALSRADQPETSRRDHFAYVDEFHSFATESFASILSEARKYRLGITMATQYVEQIDPAIQAALFGNCGSLVAFQSGFNDAELLAQQLGPEVTPHDLLRLPRYRALARLLIDGVPSRPFTMWTLPPLPPSWSCQTPEVIRRRSQHQYAPVFA